MNKRMYKKIAKREDKAKLISKIIKFTNGELNKKQIEKIVNYKDTESKDYIKFTKDAKEFAKEITLIDHEDEHSWAGEEYTKEKAEVIFGTCTFGEDFQYSYSDNGNIINENEYIEEPDFNIEDTICVYKRNHYKNTYDDRYDEEYKYSIIIYAGNPVAYKIDSEIQYILDNFNIEED